MTQTLFFLSGSASLIYELVWLRVTAQVFGNTTHAIGTVVAIFMGGLTLGSWIGGLGTLQSKNSLRLYGLLEAGVALLSAGLPYVLRALDAPMASLLLLPPTILMGATFPVFSHFLSRDSNLPSREIARAYAVNTLGGGFGLLLAGFCLLPLVGIVRTNFIAVGLSVVVALGAFVLSAKAPLRSPSPLIPPPSRGRGRGEGVFEKGSYVIWICAALAGFSSLVYETAWARSLVLSFGSTVYAFSLVLSAFLLGLALGAFFVARMSGKIEKPRLASAWLMAGVSAFVLVLLPFLGDLPARITPWVEQYQGSFKTLFFLQAGLSLLFVLVPAVLIGTALPLFFRIGIAEKEGRGFLAGGLYAVNTIGAIGGSLFAAFFLIPKIGLSRAIITASAVSLATALLLRGLSRWKSALLLAALWIVCIVLVPSWDVKVLSRGGYLRGSGEAQVLAHFWDSYGLVTVHRFKDDSLALRINGKTDASTNPLDMLTQLLLGHIPLLTASVSQPPEDVFILGLGAGITLSAVERYPVKNITVVELSPGVIRAAPWFGEANGEALADPRVALLVADGRRFLKSQERTYDVIISEPSNLWVSGMANLFTREFFELGRKRLNPGGLMGQWIHAYALSPDDFKTVLRTFYSVFPHGGVWELLPGYDYLLVGREEPLIAEKEEYRRFFDAFVGQDLQPVGIASFDDLAGRAMMDSERARAFAGKGPVITDDLNRVEYTAPMAMLGQRRRGAPVPSGVPGQ